MQDNKGLDVRIANAGGDRSHPATRAMFNTLDKTSAGIADILVGADKSETLLQGWHNDSAGQGNVLGNVLTLLAALQRGTEGHDVLSAVLAQSQVANDCVQQCSRFHAFLPYYRGTATNREEYLQVSMLLWLETLENGRTETYYVHIFKVDIKTCSPYIRESLDSIGWSRSSVWRVDTN